MLMYTLFMMKKYKTAFFFNEKHKNNQLNKAVKCMTAFK